MGGWASWVLSCPIVEQSKVIVELPSETVSEPGADQVPCSRSLSTCCATKQSECGPISIAFWQSEALASLGFWSPGVNVELGTAFAVLGPSFPEEGPLRIRSPRDRNGTFEPQIVKKRQTRWVGFDDRVISLYARGLTVREIQGHLAEIYGTEVSPDLISKITDTVLADAKAWQNRPLERVYPIVYLDALIVKIRDGHTVRNQACYVALGVNLDGERDVLGLWFQQTEGAKFWLHVLTDLKTRGVADILFVCVDGLTGFPEAIEATFPHATVQTCLVHQVRSSMRFVSYKDRKPLAADLRKIYTAVDAEHAADELTAFAEKWDHRYPMISASWLEHWEQITPFLAYPADVRRVIYTTNSIEALHRQTRKIIKTRGHFPTEDAARKLIYLAITKAETKWKRVFNWPAALGRVQNRVR